jgi:tetratricopeptide (TPR) repeat protein
MSPAGSEESPSVPTGSPPVSRSRPRIRLRRKLLYAGVVCCGFFALLEGLLALCGVKPLYLVRDPYVGFQAGIPLFLRDGEELHTNPGRLAYFNDQRFPAVKAPQTFRVFTLGGSTTFGHPYEDSTSFSGWLREILHEAAPDRKWEVVNCGGISYASYRVCLLMEELTQYQPDLFIIYTGHNEFLEARTYPHARESSRALSCVQGAVARTRMGTVLSQLSHSKRRDASATQLPAEVDTILEHSVGPDSYHRATLQREDVVRHFHESLERMCGLARAAGARVIFVEPAANVRDFSPFKSEASELSPADSLKWMALMKRGRAADKAEAALESFVEACRLDPHNAESQWEAGRALLAAGDCHEAGEALQHALDEDVCPLRASGAVRAEVRAVADRNKCPLVKFPAMLEQHAERETGCVIPGNESFLDHVHPTLEGNRALAWALFDVMTSMGITSSPADRNAVTLRVTERVRNGLDSRQHALALVQVIQVLSWAGKNAEALRLCDEAETLHPGLSDVISYRGRLLEKTGDFDAALSAYRQAVDRDPGDVLARSRLAHAQLSRNMLRDAQVNFAQALHDAPEAAPLTLRASLRLGLARTLFAQGAWHDAEQECLAALRLSPDNIDAQRLRDACLERQLAPPQVDPQKTKGP